jgi:hypothetical protein
MLLAALLVASTAPAPDWRFVLDVGYDRRFYYDTATVERDGTLRTYWMRSSWRDFTAPDDVANLYLRVRIDCVARTALVTRRRFGAFDVSTEQPSDWPVLAFGGAHAAIANLLCH